MRVAASKRVEQIETAIALNQELMIHLMSCPDCDENTCSVADELLDRAKSASKLVGGTL